MQPPSFPQRNGLPGPDDLVAGFERLPSAAAVLPRLLGVLNSSTSSLDEVVEILRLDAGIASRLLHVANSAFYSRGVRCEALTDAVYRVGFLKVYELVSITAASKLFLQPLAAYGISAEEIWRRSVTAAIAAEILAERATLDPHLAYTVGLLHGVGMIAIDRWAMTRDPFPMMASRGYPKETTANEIAVIGFTNASAANSLLHSWGFPDSLVEPIRFQYDPRAASMRNHPMACLLSVAKWLRDAAHLQPGQAAPAEPDRWALQLLRLTGNDLGRLALVTRGTFEYAMQLFGDSQAPAQPAGRDAAQQ